MSFKPLFSFLAIVLCLGAVVAHAEVVAQAEPPEVFVKDITLPKNTYKAGETVTGTFVMQNGTPNVNIPDVTYQVSLTGDYTPDGLANTYYDTKTYGPIFLQINEVNKVVNFSYELPKTFSGTDLGIHIRAYLKTGNALGWADSKITVTGGMSFINITSNSLLVDSKYTTEPQPFPVMSGPTIYKDKAGSLLVSITNPSKEALTLAPHIVIYDRFVTGAVMKTYDEAVINLPAGKSQDLKFQLPTFDYKAGIYLGQLTFMDAQGIARSLPVQFRYIIAGDLLTISSIASPQTSVMKGNPISLTLNYAGTPYDIFTAETSGVASADLSVNVYNEKDVVIAHYEQNMDFSQGTSKVIPITATADAKALRVEATVSNAGTQIATYSANLSPNYKDIHDHPVSDYGKKIGYGLIALAVIIAAIVIGLFVRRKNTKLIVGIILLLGTGLILGHQAIAFTKTGGHDIIWSWDYGTDDPWIPAHNNSNPNAGGYQPFGPKWPWKHYASATASMQPHVVINSPTSASTLSPGQQFYITGSSYALACENNPQDILVTMTFNGKTLSHRYNDVNGFVSHSVNTGHQVSNNPVLDFSLGPFTAPSSSGTYQAQIRVDNFTNVPGQVGNANHRQLPQFANRQATPATPDTTGGDTEGTQTIVVAAAPLGNPPTVTLTADPNPVDSGSQTTLTWVTTNNPTSCVASDGWSGSKSTAGGTQLSGILYTSAQYTITCTNAAGTSGSVSRTVTINPPSTTGTPAPTQPLVQLFATPASVNSVNNYTTNLTWNSNNANYCTSSDFTVPIDPATGQGMVNNYAGVPVGPLSPTHSGPYTFTINCYNSQLSSSPGIATVQVTASNDVDGTCAPATVGQQPTGSDVNSIVNKQVTWKAFPTGPVTNITWSFTGLDPSVNQSQFDNQTTVTLPYTTVGKKTATATFTSDATPPQTKTVNCSANINVKPDPRFIETI